MKYEIILENEEDGRFSAHVPSLPGWHSWGENREETITNIKEAIELHLESLGKEGVPLKGKKEVTTVAVRV